MQWHFNTDDKNNNSDSNIGSHFNVYKIDDDNTNFDDRKDVYEELYFPFPWLNDAI